MRTERTDNLVMVDDESMEYYGSLIYDCPNCGMSQIAHAFRGRALYESDNLIHEIIVHMGECRECGHEMQELFDWEQVQEVLGKQEEFERNLSPSARKPKKGGLLH